MVPCLLCQESEHGSTRDADRATRQTIRERRPCVAQSWIVLNLYSPIPRAAQKRARVGYNRAALMKRRRPN